MYTISNVCFICKLPHLIQKFLHAHVLLSVKSNREPPLCLAVSFSPVVTDDPLPFQSSFIDVYEECVLVVFSSFRNVSLVAYLLMVSLKLTLFKSALLLSRRHEVSVSHGQVYCDPVAEAVHPSLGKKASLPLWN